MDKTHVLILSMRAVPLIDTSGLEAMTALRKRLNAAGGVLMLAAVNDKVRTMLDRGGLTELIGPENIFWSADQAIVAAEALSCPYCQTEGQTAPRRDLRLHQRGRIKTLFTHARTSHPACCQRHARRRGHRLGVETDYSIRPINRS